MKKILLIPFLFLSSTAVIAQSAAVLQHAGTSSSFYGNTALQVAYTAAVNGDTIYLPGGFFPPPVSFDKRLTIIGAGHHPDSSAVTLTTVISGDIALAENSDGSFFSGFKLNGRVILAANNVSASNISFTRINISGSIELQGDRTNPCINGLIKDCVIGMEVNCTNISQFVFANNVFLSRIQYVESSLFTNNIFLGGDDIGGIFRIIYNTNQCVIRNNIFFKPFADLPNSTSNQFQNNIFSNSPVLVNNFLSGNYFNVTTASVFVAYGNDGFTYVNNYHLKTPANFIGSDALQVGLYGSVKPWKEGSIPVNPHIQSKMIAENTDNNGAIQVQVKVAAQNQ